MRRWMRVVTAFAGGAAGSAAAAIGTGALLWNRSTAREVSRLAPGGTAGTFTRDQLAGLPDPVVRYFEFALTPGQPLSRTARIEHEGDSGDMWMAASQTKPGGSASETVLLTGSGIY